MKTAKRVAVLNDIHANLPALDAVLEHVRAADVDLIVLGGDVLPGPMPLETMARIRALEVPVECLHGNGELAILAQLDAAAPDEVTYWGTTGGVPLPEKFREWLRWTARELDAASAREIAGWPKTLRVRVDGVGDVLFCHGTPTSETDAFTHLTPEDVLRPVFDSLGVSLVVCGHTHLQFDRIVGATRVVNAGSVGCPFGRTGADWLLLGPGIELRHASYNLEAAAAQIRACTFPGAHDFATTVLNPPAEAAMAEAFSRVSF